ncbi:hypothetical protein BDZ85DRAFT_73916 [Elsinoe ampelina]|uniref:Uncharacterized protein n=1 Tax=Elsinoe ampelina TaxID=302913 RepID=A0A6A6GJP7_9PEZI|nr:hypothetical protein BDZ85DRAFT_73916 [Elsinoe ampelina]
MALPGGSNDLVNSTLTLIGDSRRALAALQSNNPTELLAHHRPRAGLDETQADTNFATTRNRSPVIRATGSHQRLRRSSFQDTIPPARPRAHSWTSMDNFFPRTSSLHNASVNELLRRVLSPIREELDRVAQEVNRRQGPRDSSSRQREEHIKRAQEVSASIQHFLASLTTRSGRRASDTEIVANSARSTTSGRLGTISERALSNAPIIPMSTTSMVDPDSPRRAMADSQPNGVAPVAPQTEEGMKQWLQQLILDLQGVGDWHPFGPSYHGTPPPPPL